MHLDIDQIAASVVSAPWDLAVTVRGTRRRIRRLTNLQVKQIADAGRNPASLSGEAGEAFVAGLFEQDDRPSRDELRSWEQEVVGLLVGAVMAYYQQHTLVGKLRTIQTAVAAGAGGTEPADKGAPGTSSSSH